MEYKPKNLVLALFRLCLVLTALFSNPSIAATYQAYGPTTPYTWVDIAATGTNVALADDAVSGLLNIGFTFNYGGTNHTQLRIASNGMLFFPPMAAPTGNWWNNTSVATAQANYAITNSMMAYWTDLNPNIVATRIKYQSLGVAPNRQFVVSYLAVPTFNNTGANTFQVILNEDGTFLYNYQTTNTQGGGANPEGATIGYHVSTADLVEFSLDTASVPNQRTIFWTKPPLLTHLKIVAPIFDPVTGVSTPHHIPGGVAQYTIRLTNSGAGPVGNNSVIITDPIPVNSSLCVASIAGAGGCAGAGAPFTFTNGAPTSNLTCAFISLADLTDCIDFSNDNAATWNYVPSGTFDSTVTHIRFRTTGAMAANTGAGNPSFEIKFNVQVK